MIFTLTKFTVLTILIPVIFLISLNKAYSQEKELTDAIEEVHQYFSTASPLKEDIHSFLVSQNGQLITEHYYNGFRPDSINNVKSVTKSIIGLLVGIAIDKGIIKDVYQKVNTFFKDCATSPSFVEKKDITIEHLLQMQSGIEWNNRARIKDEWWFHESPHCFLLEEFPMDTLPGKQFSYNSAAAHLLSGIISRASGQSTLAFAQQYLFSPLNIQDFYWEQDRSGEYRGHSELYLRPSDMIKIGQLLLAEGEWKKERIISEKWMQQTISKAYNATSLMNYGYLWMTGKDKDPFYFFAGGSGGHHIFIVPAKKLVVVTTGHWDNARSTREIMEACRDRLIRN